MKTNRQEVDRGKSTISSLKMVEIKVEHVIKIPFSRLWRPNHNTAVTRMCSMAKHQNS